MTISAAIELLKRFQSQYGDVEVYFDCPGCNQAFTPDYVAKQAAVVKGEKRHNDREERRP